MDRRQFISLAASTASTVWLAGCASSSSETTTTNTTSGSSETAGTPTDGDGTTGKPDGIYVQSFQETMAMQGQRISGDYRFGLMFTVPHTFWTVTGTDVSKTARTDADAIHLMASVWDAETGTVLPETGLSVEISDEDGLVSEEVIYPMLSQPMSFHYGGNFPLPGDGSYTVTVSVGGTNIRRTGAFEGKFDSPASVDIPLAFTEESRRAVTTREIEQAGNPGALAPMETMFPQAILPEANELPGTVRGTTGVDDARFVVTTLDSASRVGADSREYLAVSARTRYNRYVLPAMALSATLDRDGRTMYDGGLERTLSPDLGYHYGVAVDDVQHGDKLTLSVDTPPQVARHEGYETAFLQMDDTTLTL